MTGITAHAALILDFAVIASDRIFERNAHTDLDIFSDISSLSSASTTESSTKK
jgi:hypothetical protein